MRHLRSIIVIMGLILGLNACAPLFPEPYISKPTPTMDPALSISATVVSGNDGAGLPAGLSTSYLLTLNYAPDRPPESVIWTIQNMSKGISTKLIGQTVPWQTRVLVTADQGLKAGTYSIDVIPTVKINQTLLSVVKKIRVQVTDCIETPSGSSTQAINSNLVELITAGKPAVEHGLLVPIQICGNQKHLSIKLTSATAENGSTMTTLPAFYVFHSEVWPAPDHIIAHGLTELLNVQVPIVAQANHTGQLDADVGAGLYLLIFEHDRFGATLTPQTMPASVTYTLTVK